MCTLEHWHIGGWMFAAGTARLVGTDRRTIIDNVSTLLTDEKAYIAMANAVNPYGDGKACERIVRAIRDGNIC